MGYSTVSANPISVVYNYKSWLHQKLQSTLVVCVHRIFLFEWINEMLPRDPLLKWLRLGGRGVQEERVFWQQQVGRVATHQLRSCVHSLHNKSQIMRFDNFVRTLFDWNTAFELVDFGGLSWSGKLERKIQQLYASLNPSTLSIWWERGIRFSDTIFDDLLGQEEKYEVESSLDGQIPGKRSLASIRKVHCLSHSVLHGVLITRDTRIVR